MAFKHEKSVAATLRSGFDILSPLNEKTPKGEAQGYLQAILYMAPHQLAGGKTVCPHSTEACRAGCLYSAGRGKTPRVQNARLRRTRLFHEDRETFFDTLIGELVLMRDVARQAGLKLAVRLNGTSDIGWERETFERGRTLFDLFPEARFFDYTRWPAEHRKVPPNWHLTFSLADDPAERAMEHWGAGRNVAAVMPAQMKARLLGNALTLPGLPRVAVVDGDEHDLRFLDPSPALVLLTPKGRLLRGGPMVRGLLPLELLRTGELVH